MWYEVEGFVRRQLREPAQKIITPETRLEDLHIRSDDADHFVDLFFLRFGIEPGDYDRSRYFPVKGPWPVRLVRKFTSERRNGSVRVPLTLRMLTTAARLGEWRTESVERAERR
ncbi:DUF1493 family protein (plasmid) [Paraburkholderia sp. DD10]|uniref:DUF1493 family protein n=1 Tax=Paraburkholderia sp. DD10 TaxID=3409691 RepID=UPI003BA1A084